MSKIVSIKRVKNNALQGELVDTVQVSPRMNVLAKLNIGDERFRVGSERHAWFPVTMLALAQLGFSKEDLDKIEKLEYGNKLTVNYEHPKVDGFELTIQVNETVIADQWQYQNVMKSAKQLEITAEVAANKGLATDFDLSKYIGQTGYFMDENNNFIFSRTIVTVKPQVRHTVIEAKLIPSTELSEFGATLHEPISVGETEEVKEEQKEEQKAGA
jgi:hypothetical protein